ncbi:MAG: methyltransferase domain-containing protein [Endozoicomonas sp.]|uniref:methyltransferase domain-containing protein n=1 Tax=Endozoicomonas sp. TaxID=1892382 RepID=UPI003D9B90B9
MFLKLSRFFAIALTLLFISFYSLASKDDGGERADQQFLDSHQYTINGIKRYEQIFGKGFISTGGLESTRQLTVLLDLKKGQKVLDIGSGIGGSAFYMAKTYGVEVTGIDLSQNMVEIAKKQEEQKTLPVHFIHGDIMTLDLAPDSFDVIYSRDTLLHIKNKEALFKKMYTWLKPGGQFLISDYCVGDKELSEKTREYIKQRDYHLTDVQSYRDLLEKAGFIDVAGESRDQQFLDILNRELARFKNNKEHFLKEFSAQDYQDLVNGWSRKIERVQSGDQTWAVFAGQKAASVH